MINDTLIHFTTIFDIILTHIQDDDKNDELVLLLPLSGLSVSINRRCVHDNLSFPEVFIKGLWI
jgi:hypothetical protein